MNESEKKVYFSIWSDFEYKHNGERAYILQEPDWGVSDETGNKSAARKDQDEKFSLVFDQGYEPFGYFKVARDPTAHPREISETRTSFVVRLQLEILSDNSIIGIPRERIEIR